MPVERILYRPVEAAEAIGISRARLYELMNSGEIPSVRVGNVKRVPVDKLREWVDRQSGAQDEHASGGPRGR